MLLLVSGRTRLGLLVLKDRGSTTFLTSSIDLEKIVSLSLSSGFKLDNLSFSGKIISKPITLTLYDSFKVFVSSAKMRLSHGH